MEWHLTLNEQIIAQGDHKSLSVLFDCLSGVHFAKGRQASWLDKMSASESYDHYLAIKAKELGVEWNGTLALGMLNAPPERVHLFAQHASRKKSKIQARKSGS